VSTRADGEVSRSGVRDEALITTTPTLRASGITVRFGGLTALRDISIELNRGSITGLVGPNGAGKSTLLAVLAGLQVPDEGQVALSGSNITRKSPEWRARRGVARTFQKPELFGDLTVRDHLVLAHRMHLQPERTWRDLFFAGSLRRPAPAEGKSVDHLLELLELDSVASRAAQGLPIGTTRRLEIARALASQPTVLLLDEPCSGLDPGERFQCESIFRAAVDEMGVCILIVEHDTELVLRLASQVTVLDFGECIASASPEIVRRDPAVLTAYLGDLSTAGRSR
jgi:ABC-type branched-subunit amino acid transport system ATPase component